MTSHDPPSPLLPGPEPLTVRDAFLWQREMRRAFRGIRPFSLERRRFALDRSDLTAERHDLGRYGRAEGLRLMADRDSATLAREAAQIARVGAV